MGSPRPGRLQRTRARDRRADRRIGCPGCVPAGGVLWESSPLSDPTDLTVEYDFLQILLDELSALGHPYRTAVENVTFVGGLPVSATTLVRFTDRNVTLVRADLPVSQLRTANPTSHVFGPRIPVEIGGQPIAITRGWAAVDVTIRGKTYRFVNAHLEAFSRVVRVLQAQELVGALSTSPFPVVLAGDLNTLPGAPADAYGVLLAAGFVDGWIEAMGDAPGHTAGQTDDLDNFPSLIDHTVDYVFHDSDGVVDTIAGSGDILGEAQGDRTPSGLWPSDHAGVVLTLRIARP